MGRTQFGGAKEGQPADKQPGETSRWEAGNKGSIQEWAWRPPSAGASGDLPELCSQQDTGNAVGDHEVLALTGLFSGFRGALG